MDRITELPVTANISYLLNDNKDFSLTAYKVMQNQPNSGLAKCVKVMYNGKIKLVYIVDSLKPLSLVISQSGISELSAIVFNLIQRAIDIIANGFFSGDNIELDINKILVDTTNYSVHLIYLPISSGYTGKISNFENEFRVMLINMFNSYPVFSSPQFQHLCSDLSNGTLSLNYILKRLQESLNGKFGVNPAAMAAPDPQHYAPQQYPPQQYPPQQYPPQQYPPQQYPPQQYPPQQYPPQQYPPQQYSPRQYPPLAPASAPAQPPLSLKALDAPGKFSLTVSKPEYTIGKNPSMVDGAVTYNPAISRVHCKITYEGGSYYITDSGSANGTYLNKTKLHPQEKCRLTSGDFITLANSSFSVSY